MSQLQRLQVLLLVGVFFVALAFSFLLVKGIFEYVPLRARAPAQILRWEVEEVGGKFALRALYSFECKEKIWEGSCRLVGPYDWNEPAAIASLEKRAKEVWAVWYSPKNPAHSTLEKRFPLSLLFRTLVCYGILGYVFVLNRRCINFIPN